MQSEKDEQVRLSKAHSHSGDAYAILRATLRALMGGRHRGRNQAPLEEMTERESLALKVIMTHVFRAAVVEQRAGAARVEAHRAAQMSRCGFRTRERSESALLEPPPALQVALRLRDARTQ